MPGDVWPRSAGAKEKAMKMSALSQIVLAVAVAVVLCGDAQAKPKGTQSKTACTCTCVAYDDNGTRHEGDKFEFNTEQDCGVGFNVSCRVGELKGSYAKCDGKTFETLLPRTHGVQQPAGTLQP
jgi:hypothetical protein